MKEVLDQAEYQAYRQLESDTPVYSWLRRVPAIDNKKARFFSDGFSENPNLKPQLDSALNRARAWGYTALKDQIASGNADQVIKDAYIPAIESKLSGLAMLDAAANNDPDAFAEANIEAYGQPDKFIFDTLCAFARQLAEQNLHEPKSLYTTEAAKQVLDLLPDTFADTAKLWPTPAQFRKAKKLFANFFDEMYQGVELPERASGQEVVNIIEQVLQNLNFDYSVQEQERGVNTMSASSVLQAVKVPLGEVYTDKRLKGLIAHEVRIHVEESKNGEKQPLMLLAKGLRGSAKAGEGKGVLVEQVAYDNAEEFLQTQRFFDIARRHISIGLALGLDGNGQRDFKEVFQIINALDRLWELSQDPDNPKRALTKALDRSWELLTKRTLKGMVGKGVAYYKDKIYAEGNREQLLMIIKNPEALPYLNKGHYDLTNAQHVSVLKKIGTLPTGLNITTSKS